VNSGMKKQIGNTQKVSPLSDRDIWQRAIDMLNEIHERMGIDMVIQAKMERLAVDNIAQKHFKRLQDDLLGL